MDMLGIVALGFALCYSFFEALKALITYLDAPAPKPATPLIIFVYCLIAGLILLYEGGILTGLRR